MQGTPVYFLLVEKAMGNARLLFLKMSGKDATHPSRFSEEAPFTRQVPTGVPHS